MNVIVQFVSGLQTTLRDAFSANLAKKYITHVARLDLTVEWGCEPAELTSTQVAISVLKRGCAISFRLL